MDKDFKLIEDVSKELECVELEERLEMAQVAAAETSRCNAGCDTTLPQSVK